MTTGLPLRKRVLNPLAKSVFVPLGLSAVMSAADAANQNQIHGSSTTALIISNKKIEDIMKIVKPLEELGLLIKEISETIKGERKRTKRHISFNVIRNMFY